jgi:hypothetical protein
MAKNRTPSRLKWDLKCSSRTVNQLRLIGALVVWIVCLFIFFPPRKVINESPLSKFVTSGFNDLPQDEKVFATVYAAYLADLASDHPDVLLYNALSDQELAEFMVHGGRSLSEEDFNKYRIKSFEDETRELKERAAEYLNHIGESEFKEIRESVRDQILGKMHSWPEQAKKSVFAFMEYTADLHPASLSGLPSQSILQILQTWQHLAEENKEKYWPKEWPY